MYEEKDALAQVLASGSSRHLRFCTSGCVSEVRTLRFLQAQLRIIMQKVRQLQKNTKARLITRLETQIGQSRCRVFRANPRAQQRPRPANRGDANEASSFFSHVREVYEVVRHRSQFWNWKVPSRRLQDRACLRVVRKVPGRTCRPWSLPDTRALRGPSIRKLRTLQAQAH